VRGGTCVADAARASHAGCRLGTRFSIGAFFAQVVDFPFQASLWPESPSILKIAKYGPLTDREVKMQLKAIILAFLIVGTPACSGQTTHELQDGDIVFQESRSAQSSAIQLATGSRYSHMGIIYLVNGEAQVFEAVEPVKSTPLDEWVARGAEGHFVVKRLADADELLTPSALQKMLDAGRSFVGKHYDLRFEWSDDRIYCSELVWKIYNRALGLEIGDLETFGDFDTLDPAVQKKIVERWGRQPPLDQVVISPATMFQSDLLVTVYQE
jgi:hypothetical protein